MTEEMFTQLRAGIRSGLDVTLTLQDGQLMEYIERHVLEDNRLDNLK